MNDLEKLQLNDDLFKLFLLAEHGLRVDASTTLSVLDCMNYVPIMYYDHYREREELVC